MAAKTAASQIKWLFIGPPGVGKGTYVSRAAMQLDISHFSSGTMLREVAKKDTIVGKRIKSLIDKGQFVTNETVSMMILDELSNCERYSELMIKHRANMVQTEEEIEAENKVRGLNIPDHIMQKAMKTELGAEVLGKVYKAPPKVLPYPGGYILDGFPRNLEQAQYVDSLSEAEAGLLKVEKVVNLRQPYDVILQKISGRRSCAKCDMVYNFARIDEGGIKMDPLMPKVPGVCDRCGHDGPLIERADDCIDVVRKRLDLYEEVTHPLEEYYAKDGRLVHFDVLGGVKQFLPQLMDVLEKEAEGVLAKRK